MRALESRRVRRRLALGVVTAAAVGAVTAAILVGNTAAPEMPRSNGPAVINEPQPRVTLTRGDRREILAIAKQFVATAVRREHPERAWPLASKALKSGQTFAAWKAGSLPVEPYPVRRAKSTFAYAVAGEVGLDVFVEATDANLSSMVFRLTVVSDRDRAQRRWLVDGWSAMPNGGYVSTPWRNAAPQPELFTPRASARVSPLWIAVPFAVFGLALLVPLFALVNSRRGGRSVNRRSQWQ
jgi:hypothetical protein